MKPVNRISADWMTKTYGEIIVKLPKANFRNFQIPQIDPQSWGTFDDDPISGAMKIIENDSFQKLWWRFQKSRISIMIQYVV